MPRKPRAASDETPAGHLHEAGLLRVLGYQLAQAAIGTEAVFSACVGGPLGLHKVEYTLLMLIGENPACSSGRLARALAMSPANITAWTTRMEQAGWVLRATSTTDRRANHLQLTPAGRALADEASRRVHEGEAALQAGLSPAERAMLLELLHKLARQRPQR